MPKKEDEKKPAAAADASSNGDDNADETHEEAADILTNLLANQGATGTGGAAATTSGGNTQVGEAQQAAIQQMMQQLKLGGVLPGANGVAGGEDEKRHAFWDTQVRYCNITEREREILFGLHVCFVILIVVARDGFSWLYWAFGRDVLSKCSSTSTVT